MFNHDIFKAAYLTDLHIIKEAEEIENETNAEDKIVKKITFLTSDEKLIDALNSGFEETVLFVNAKDETTGEDTVVEVKFGKDSFGDITVEDFEEDETDEYDDDLESDEDFVEDDEIGECGDTDSEDAIISDDVDEYLAEDNEDPEAGVEEPAEEGEEVEEPEDAEEGDEIVEHCNKMHKSKYGPY